MLGSQHRYARDEIADSRFAICYLLFAICQHRVAVAVNASWELALGLAASRKSPF
jgi:hypothetical protein